MLIVMRGLALLKTTPCHKLNNRLNNRHHCFNIAQSAVILIAVVVVIVHFWCEVVAVVRF